MAAYLQPFYEQLRALVAATWPEVVENGVTGLVVPRGNSKALAQAIGSLLADPQRRRQMGQAGRERALRLFDWDRTAEQFEEIYREVASRMPR